MQEMLQLGGVRLLIAGGVVVLARALIIAQALRVRRQLAGGQDSTWQGLVHGVDRHLAVALLQSLGVFVVFSFATWL
jgi:hypothetical protein